MGRPSSASRPVRLARAAGHAHVARPARLGLARRIALVFVRLFGRTSLGVSYALLATDVIARDQHPVDHRQKRRHRASGRPEHRRAVRLDAWPLGGQARDASSWRRSTRAVSSPARCSSPARRATCWPRPRPKLVGIDVTWSSWFVAGVVPGAVSCLVVPFWSTACCHPPCRPRRPPSTTRAGS